MLFSVPVSVSVSVLVQTSFLFRFRFKILRSSFGSVPVLADTLVPVDHYSQLVISSTFYKRILG